MKRLILLPILFLTIICKAQTTQVKVHLITQTTVSADTDLLIIDKADSTKTRVIKLSNIRYYFHRFKIADTALGNNAKYVAVSGTDMLVNLSTSNTSDTIYVNNLDTNYCTPFRFNQWNASTTIYLKGGEFVSGTGTATSLNMGYSPFAIVYDKKIHGWIKLQ